MAEELDAGARSADRPRPRREPPAPDGAGDSYRRHERFRFAFREEFELELLEELELELLEELELEFLDELELELLEEFELELPAEAVWVLIEDSSARSTFPEGPAPGAGPSIAAVATTSPQAPSPAYVFQRFAFVGGLLGATIVDLRSVGFDSPAIVPGPRESNMGAG